MKNILSIIGTTAALISPAVSAQTAQERLDEATAKYELRGTEAGVTDVIRAANEGLALSPDADQKFQLHLIKAKALYYKGLTTVEVGARRDTFNEAMGASIEVTTQRPDLAEGYYFYAISLARWGEPAPLTAIRKVGMLMNNLRQAAERPTFDGEDGSSLDGNGADRVMGRVHLKLSILPGYSKSQSKVFLEKAVQAAPWHSLNQAYLAETLIEMGSKTEGCQILNTLLPANTSIEDRSRELGTDYDRVPETLIELRDAQALKARSCS